MIGRWTTAYQVKVAWQIRQRLEYVAAEAAPYSRVFVFLFIVTLIAYSSLATSIVLTNHTFPNSLISHYPSFKTLNEGRWAADIFQQLSGGAGVQTVQFTGAIAINSLNAILLCRLVRLKSHRKTALIGVLFCLHPAFLDDLSFTSDSIGFMLGDSLALIGALLLVSQQNSLVRVTGSAVLFMITLATYQPKAALICCLVPIALLANTLSTKRGSRGLMQAHIEAATAIVIAFFLYYVLFKMLTQPFDNERGHINSSAEVIAAIRNAYPNVSAHFSTMVDYLPKPLFWLPGTTVVAGVVSILLQALRIGIAKFCSALIAILVLPIGMQMTYLIDSQAWLHVGRILFVEAYILAAFAAFTLQQIIGGPLAFGGVLIQAYVFWAGATQAGQAAALKTVFEEAKINRILTRIETVTPNLYNAFHPIVVVGEIGMGIDGSLRRFRSALYQSQLTTETFIGYRQVEILNFFASQDQFLRPTQVQLNEALALASNRAPWPSAESVFTVDDTVVVLLQPVGSGMPTTWVQGQLTGNN